MINVLTMPKTEGNDIKVFRVTYDNLKRNKRTSTAFMSKERAEKKYQEKLTNGLNPQIVIDWIAGWAF